MYDWIQDRESFNRAFEQSPDFLMREARERERERDLQSVLRYRERK